MLTALRRGMTAGPFVLAVLAAVQGVQGFLAGTDPCRLDGGRGTGLRARHNPDMRGQRGLHPCLVASLRRRLQPHLPRCEASVRILRSGPCHDSTWHGARIARSRPERPRLARRRRIMQVQRTAIVFARHMLTRPIAAPQTNGAAQSRERSWSCLARIES